MDEIKLTEERAAHKKAVAIPSVNQPVERCDRIHGMASIPNSAPVPGRCRVPSFRGTICASKLFREVRMAPRHMELTKYACPCLDSRGIYDAMVRNVSSLHGLRSGRSGYELAISVAQAIGVNASLRWVNGDRQLADPLTKGGAAKKLMMQFLANGQWWTLIHDPMFVSGRNLKKKMLQEAMEKQFTTEVHLLATKHRWPWPESGKEHDLRILGDEPTREPWSQKYM